jgi:hypothetical protein
MLRSLRIDLVVLGCLVGACGRDPAPLLDDGETSSGSETETETGEPPTDLPSEPPPLLPEASFVSIPAHDYELVPPDGTPTPLSTDAHRQFYAFQPSANEPDDDPIFVFFNGGPGASSAILLGFNIGPKTFAPAATGDAEIADNPYSWTSLGNLLWIDGRNRGFSYSLLDDPSDEDTRENASSFANFNPYLDAADFVRVLLEFLARHPSLRDNEIILVAESYGGTRAQMMLDMLLHAPAYADGGRRLIDTDLAERIAEHHELSLGVPAPPPEQVALQFGRQILIQPLLAGSVQYGHAGAYFEQPGSIMYDLAEQLGFTYTLCSEQEGYCDPFSNAHDHVKWLGGRSAHDTNAPASWLNDVFALVDARCNDTAVIEALLDVPLSSIPDMAPAARSKAWRTINHANYPTDAEAGDIDESLGALAEWDRYFIAHVSLGSFSGIEAMQYEIGMDDPHHGENFLRNLLWVDTLITSTERDLVIYTPALPNALRDYSSIVQDVQVGAGEWTIQYQPDAFAEWPDPGSRTVRVPTYDGSHAISLDAPEKLRDDVAAWLQ